MSHPTITQQITFLYTDDLAATTRFYEGVFGFRLALDQGTCRIYHTAIDSYLGFCQRQGVQPEHSDVVFTLVTPDVDGWFAFLRRKGIAFEKTPAVNLRFNIYHFFLRDPNGYLIEIQRFLDPDWNQEQYSDKVSL